MRRTTRVWWICHPNIILMLYRSLLCPHLDFGSILVGKFAKTLLLKMDRTQYQALMVALGYMKSTPINIILAESNELSLKYRRRWLGFRFVSKMSCLEGNKVWMAVEELNKFGGFWNDKILW